MLNKVLSFSSDIKLILVTTLLSNVGMFMVVPFLAIYLNDLHTITTAQVGVIIGVAVWCQRAGSLLGGVLSDYFQVKKTMLLGLAIRIPGYILVGFIDDFYLLLLSCSLIGLGSSIYLPAAKSFLVKIVNEDEKVNVLSTRMIFSYIGVAIGPIIGMAVFKASAPWLFVSVGLIFFVLMVMNVRLHGDINGNVQAGAKIADVKKLMKNKMMIGIALFMFLFMVLYMQLEVTIPMFSSRLFGSSSASYLFVCNALIVILFQIPIANWACKGASKSPMILAFLLFAAAFSVVDDITNSYYALMLAIVLFSLAEIIIQIRLDYDATNVNDHMIATAFGIMSLSGAFGSLCGSYFGTLLYSKSTADFSIWRLLAICSTVIALIYFIKPGINATKSCNQ